jgi:hypothetical protein
LVVLKVVVVVFLVIATTFIVVTFDVNESAKIQPSAALVADDKDQTNPEYRLSDSTVDLAKTITGFTVESKTHPYPSHFDYLNKIAEDSILIDKQFSTFERLALPVLKLNTAMTLQTNLQVHLADYALESGFKPQEIVSHPGFFVPKAPLPADWLTNKKDKSKQLTVVEAHINQVLSAEVDDIDLAAAILTAGIGQEDVFVCPIFQSSGHWLAENHPLYYHLRQQLPLVASEITQAQYFLLGWVSENDNEKQLIEYHLVDNQQQLISKQEVVIADDIRWPLTHWQSWPLNENAVLTSITHEFTDKLGKRMAANTSDTQALYRLAEQELFYPQGIIRPEPCKPINRFSDQALIMAYGVNKQADIHIDALISALDVNSPSTMNDVALAKVTLTRHDLNDQPLLTRQTMVAKAFPVIAARTAFMQATGIAFNKLKAPKGAVVNIDNRLSTQQAE